MTIPINTRFCPTPSGELHIGHYLTALVNEYEAHSTGGKFVLCFDDDQEDWDLRQTREEIEDIKGKTIRTLAALGLSIDKVTSNSEMASEIKRYYAALGADSLLPMKSLLRAERTPNFVGREISTYPYHPYLTMTKVIADYINLVNLVIRGEDLVGEFSLYDYFCERLRLPIIEHAYLSRLKISDGREISKTNHFPSLQELLDKGWQASDIERLLRQAALIHPDREFSLRNLKGDPRLPEEVEL